VLEAREGDPNLDVARPLQQRPVQVARTLELALFDLEVDVRMNTLY